jgi:hypothetical protein
MGRNQSDRNLRHETQAQLDDLADERDSRQYDETNLELGEDVGMNQTGTGTGDTAMRTRATPKAATQQATSTRHKKGNQAPER